MARTSNGTKRRNKLGEMIDRSRYKPAEIAELIGVDKSLVSRWVSGEREPTPEQIEKLEDLCGGSKLATDDDTQAYRSRLYQRRPDVPPTTLGDGWIARLVRTGYEPAEHTNGENEHVAEKLGDHLGMYPELIPVVLRALRKFL